MAGTLAASVAANLCLINDIKHTEVRVDDTLERINSVHLAAMLYVLRNKEIPNNIKIKEETKMAKSFKVSNRTKVIGGVLLLVGIATAASAVIDNREVAEIENELMELEPVEALEGAVAEAVEAVAGE